MWTIYNIPTVAIAPHHYIFLSLNSTRKWRNWLLSLTETPLLRTANSGRAKCPKPCTRSKPPTMRNWTLCEEIWRASTTSRSIWLYNYIFLKIIQISYNKYTIYRSMYVNAISQILLNTRASITKHYTYIPVF